MSFLDLLWFLLPIFFFRFFLPWLLSRRKKKVDFPRTFSTEEKARLWFLRGCAILFILWNGYKIISEPLNLYSTVSVSPNAPIGVIERATENWISVNKDNGDDVERLSSTLLIFKEGGKEAYNHWGSDTLRCRDCRGDGAWGFFAITRGLLTFCYAATLVALACTLLPMTPSLVFFLPPLFLYPIFEVYCYYTLPSLPPSDSMFYYLPFPFLLSLRHVCCICLALIVCFYPYEAQRDAKYIAFLLLEQSKQTIKRLEHVSKRSM